MFSVRVPLTVLLALMEAGVASGLDIRSALSGVAAAQGPGAEDGRALEVVSQRLAVGLAWGEAWGEHDERIGTIERALQSSWRTGSSPVLALRAARQAEDYRARSAADAAAARLAVHLTLPLALCLLPAFVLVGIVPLLLSIAGSVLGDVRT
jgi:pilus assembly protein TadC